jgi:UDP-N-acetylglucosamine transferase subunit ALG13
VTDASTDPADRSTQLPLLVVTVGSDHHPFDRLTGWVDSWLAAGGGHRVRAVVQYGTAARPQHAEAHDFVPHEQLMELLETADVVVMQGGPMGIVESRRSGRVPIAIPRLHRLGEVVDDHQVDFCTLLAGRQELVMAQNEAEVVAAIEAALADLPAMRIEPASSEEAVLASVQRFADAVAGLTPGVRRRSRRGRPVRE